MSDVSPFPIFHSVNMALIVDSSMFVIFGFDPTLDFKMNVCTYCTESIHRSNFRFLQPQKPVLQVHNTSLVVLLVLFYEAIQRHKNSILQIITLFYLNGYYTKLGRQKSFVWKGFFTSLLYMVDLNRQDIFLSCNFANNSAKFFWQVMTCKICNFFFPKEFLSICTNWQTLLILPYFWEQDRTTLVSQLL